MILYGKYDKNFGDMGDFTDKDYIPLDFNSVAPILREEMVKCYSICEDTFEELMKMFRSKLTKADSRRDLLILMRVKQSKDTNTEQIGAMGHKISDLMSKNSLVVWAAQGYETFRFDFYFYKKKRATASRHG